MNLELFAAFYENARKKGEYFSGHCTQKLKFD